MAIDTTGAQATSPAQPAAPIRLPWRAANELYSGNVTNFFHALDLVEDQCRQEKALILASAHIDGERLGALGAYQRAAGVARRRYAEAILLYDDAAEARAGCIRMLREEANRPHLPHDDNFERLADALESGDYIHLAL